MTEIAIDGEIGWDVTAAGIRKELAAADGDVTLLINSPGGLVTEGIAIYNAIREYRRKEKGTVTARVVGLAASMATYIPMAADVVEVEDNSVWMIHNPWAFAIGDQREMKKMAEQLDGLSAILARAYSERSGKESADVRAMMDEETYLYGEGILDAGFADMLLESDTEETSNDEAVALARARIGELKEKMRQSQENPDQIAALLIRAKTPDVVREIPAALAEKIKEGAMDIKALELEHPDVFAQAVQIGKAQEKDRINSLREYLAADPDNLKVQEIVDEAILAGKTVADVNARLQVAIRDGKKESGENPPALATAQDPLSGLDDVDREAMKAFGLSVEDVKKAKGVM